MIFHTGMTSGYVWDHGKPGERRATYSETADILEEIEHTLKEDLAHLVYHHKAGMLLCMNSDSCSRQDCCWTELILRSSLLMCSGGQGTSFSQTTWQSHMRPPQRHSCHKQMLASELCTAAQSRGSTHPLVWRQQLHEVTVAQVRVANGMNSFETHEFHHVAFYRLCCGITLHNAP